MYVYTLCEQGVIVYRDFETPGNEYKGFVMC
jgi:hypothetical protein